MKIASWNVNSIKARLDHVKRYLAETAPDVLMIQELKGADFPAGEFKALGYESAAVTQKAYNGVAVLSKKPVSVVMDALPGEAADDHARYLEVETAGLRLINLYLPNGNPVFELPEAPASLSSPHKRGSSGNGVKDSRLRGKCSESNGAFSVKFDYKLAWLGRLYERFAALRAEGVPFAAGGDYNVIPEEKDCYSPKAWEGDALFRPESRRAFRRLLHLGLSDAFRVHNGEPGHYTFWDYKAGRWQNDQGIRIDHFLLSPEIADRLKACAIDPGPRGWERPSDHTPIIIEIEE